MKAKYVTGFVGANQCVYGKDRLNERGQMIAGWTEPINLKQARRRLRQKWFGPGTVAIYKLVPVATRVIPRRTK